MSLKFSPERGEIRKMNLGVLRIKVVFRATGLDEVIEEGDREKPAKGTKRGFQLVGRRSRERVPRSPG